MVGAPEEDPMFESVRTSLQQELEEIEWTLEERRKRRAGLSGLEYLYYYYYY